jgi:hypothetical protein
MFVIKNIDGKDDKWIKITCFLGNKADKLSADRNSLELPEIILRAFSVVSSEFVYTVNNH